MSRILYLAGIDPALPLGHAAHVRRLTSALAARGHAVLLLCHRPSAPIAWESSSIQCRWVRGIPVGRVRHLSAEWRLARAAAEEVGRFRPDVVLVRQEIFTVAPLLFGRRAGHSAAGRTTPLVVESNGSVTGLARSSGATGARVRLARALEGRILRAADAVGVVSAGLAEIQIESHRLDRDKVFVVRNGAWVPPVPGAAEVRDQRASLSTPPEVFVAAFVGSLNLGQGISTVLRAIARLRDNRVVVWIVGDGPLVAETRAEIETLGLGGRVRLLGGRTEEEAALIAAGAQLLLAPYPSNHPHAGCGDPLKLLFGLACNRPILGSRIPALDLIDALPAGERVPADDDEAWAAALTRWRSRWDAAGRPLSDWPWRDGDGPGLRHIRAGRTWDHTAAAWETVFSSVAGARGRRVGSAGQRDE